MDNLLEYKLDLIADALGAYKIEDVATVVFRHYTRSDGEEAQLIDFYPPWSPSGGYGVYKVASEYMDEDWQRERFEKYAGVKIADLPSFEGQQAMQRRHGRPHRCEVEVGPFRLMVKPQKNDDGKDGKTLILRYLSSPEARRRPAQNQPPTQPASPARPQGQTAVQPPTKPAPAPAPTKGLTPDEWLNRAAQATESFDFDVCIEKATGLNSNDASALLTDICGPWYPERAPICAAAIREWVGHRSPDKARETYRQLLAVLVEAQREEKRDWLLSAASLDVLAARVFELYPLDFESEAKIASLWASMFSPAPYRAAHNAAYIAGMVACAREYKRLTATNMAVQTAYKTAKVKGFDAYHLTLDLGDKQPPAVTQPGLGVETHSTYSQ